MELREMEGVGLRFRSLMRFEFDIVLLYRVLCIGFRRETRRLLNNH